jgi:hypothetical protein
LDHRDYRDSWVLKDRKVILVYEVTRDYRDLKDLMGLGDHRDLRVSEVFKGNMVSRD